MTLVDRAETTSKKTAEEKIIIDQMRIWLLSKQGKVTLGPTFHKGRFTRLP